MPSPTFVVITGVAGGVTATTVAIAAADFLGEQTPVAFWLGLAVVSGIGTMLLVGVKKWLETQVNKLIDLPTKGEIFEAIKKGIESATSGQKEVLAAVSALNIKVDSFHAELIEDYHGLDSRMVSIESRHETEDRQGLQYRIPMMFDPPKQ